MSTSGLLECNQYPRQIATKKHDPSGSHFLWKIKPGMMTHHTFVRSTKMLHWKHCTLESLEGLDFLLKQSRLRDCFSGWVGWVPGSTQVHTRAHVQKVLQDQWCQPCQHISSIKIYQISPTKVSSIHLVLKNQMCLGWISRTFENSETPKLPRSFGPCCGSRKRWKPCPSSEWTHKMPSTMASWPPDFPFRGFPVVLGFYLSSGIVR